MFNKTKVESSRTSGQRPIVVLLAIFAVISAAGSIANATSLAADQAAMELGRKVLAVREAIQNPALPNALQAVTDLGHDQRYYVMVRGWLSCQLAGDRSILAATGDQAPHAVRERALFLEKALRAIDLE